MNASDVDAWWLANAGQLETLAADGFVATAAMAARYLVAHGRESGVTVTPADRIEPIAEQIEASLWVTGPVAFKQHLVKSESVEASLRMMRTRSAAAVARQALAGSRKMTIATYESDVSAIVGYRRVARPGACDFCRMLAGRGAVYRSADSGGSQRAGRSFHDNCTCVVEPVYRVT